MKRLCFLLLLTSCSYGKCRIDSPPCPSSWKEEAAIETEIISVETFSAFNDPKLDRLIEQALNYNKTIDIAFFTLMEARYRTGVALGPLFPNVSFNPQASKQEGLFFAQGFAPGTPGVPIRGVQGDYTFPLSVNYELDLFGKWRSAYMSAVYNQKAKCDAYRLALLLVAADTAQTYFIIRSLDSELDVLYQNVDILTAALEINEARYKAGLVTYADVTRAKTELAIVQSDVENTKRLRRLSENTLAVLLGENPSLYCFAADPLENEIPLLTTPLPCHLLARRPDILEKEDEIRMFAEEVGVAFADLFPTISLAGTIGFESFSPSTLLDWQSRFWSYVISLMQTVFDAGAKASEVDAREARLYQALADYYNQALIAFREVEDALSEIRLRKNERAYLTIAVEQARETLILTNQRYLRGLISYFDVVDAQRTFLETSRSLVKVLGSEHTASVALIKALGGGY